LNGSPRDHSDLITQDHLVLVYTLVSLRLPRDEADDVAQDALERAINSLRKMAAPPVNIEAWLTTVTRRAIADYWRARERRGERETELGTWILPPDPDPTARVVSAIGTRQFIRAAANLLTSRDNEVLPLYLLVQNKYLSRAAMAGVLGVEPRNLHAFDARWRERFIEAMLVLAYLTDLSGTERCDFLVTAAQRPLSSMLRRDVVRHVGRCPLCSEHRSALTKRITGMAVAAPILLPPPGLLDNALRAHGAALRHKVTLAAAVIAATACFVVTGIFGNQAVGGADVVPSPSSTIVPSTKDTPSHRAVVTPSTEPARHSTAPVVRPSATPAPTTPAPHARPTGLTITVPTAAIQYGEITTTHSRCARAMPATSRISVVVTAPGGLVAVAMHLSFGDHGSNELMTETPSTSTWTATVGPYRFTAHADVVRIMVAAFGRDRLVRTAAVGAVRVITCR
jgi:DNA-directed RNA polymerase specialized sigma24 family protein